MWEASQRIRGFVAMAALTAAVLLAAGCGSSGDEVKVETGSLSKAAFIAKANAICKAVRTEFTNDYVKFVKSRKAKKYDSQSTEDFLGELIETVVQPHFESEIDQISALGVPSDYAPQVESYVEAVQEEVDEAQNEPTKLTESSAPFGKAIATAEKAGLDGCAESLA